MPTFKKINGKWQECQALVKEGGTWKEVGAVTAKADGKWADIAPPKPTIEPRTWTNDDFNKSGDPIRGIYFKIKAENRQYFIVGDSFNVKMGAADGWGSTPVPGLNIDGSARQFTGTIAPEAVGIDDVMYLFGIGEVYFRTADGNPIPIKPAP